MLKVLFGIYDKTTYYKLGLYYIKRETYTFDPSVRKIIYHSHNFGINTNFFYKFYYKLQLMSNDLNAQENNSFSPR